MEGQKNLRCYNKKKKEEEIISFYPKGQNRFREQVLWLSHSPHLVFPEGNKGYKFHMQKSKNKRERRRQCIHGVGGTATNAPTNA